MFDSAVMWAGNYVEGKLLETDSVSGRRLYTLEYILKGTDMSRNLNSKSYFRSLGRGGLRVRKG